jgi:hypothetical protein
LPLISGTRSKQLLLPCSINVEPWPWREAPGRHSLIISLPSLPVISPVSAAALRFLAAAQRPALCIRPYNFTSTARLLGEGLLRRGLVEEE